MCIDLHMKCLLKLTSGQFIFEGLDLVGVNPGVEHEMFEYLVTQPII